MAKAKDEFGPNDLVRVTVKRAISVDGVAFRPEVDGKRVTPIEAVIPFERAKAHGPADVEILGLAETPANKQLTPPETK